MPFLIDGHNLIAQVEGLQLSDPDDEHQLITRLRAFCARFAARATVYFDKADPASLDPPEAGGVAVRFVRAPLTADQAIVRHLSRLGGEARNWSVVSSDREVQRAAKRVGARVVPSSEFARGLRMRPDSAEPEKPDESLSPDEVEFWEGLFGGGRRHA